jgi:hypothetical protein
MLLNKTTFSYKKLINICFIVFLSRAIYSALKRRHTPRFKANIEEIRMIES